MDGSVEPKRAVPKEISNAIKVWYRSSGILRFLHISLGLIAIVLTITVASKVIDASNPYFSGIAWGAAISTGLLTSFNLGAKSNNMRNGLWSEFTPAKLSK